MTASPTDAGMPGDVGLPSEETIARAIEQNPPDRSWEKSKDSMRLVRDHAPTARAVLDLIRPAFEAKEREIGQHAEEDLAAEASLDLWRQRALSAEAKLAQAVEAMEPFDDALGEDDEGYGGGLTVVMKWGACTDYSVTLQDLRDLREAARSASRGETTALPSDKERP